MNRPDEGPANCTLEVVCTFWYIICYISSPSGYNFENCGRRRCCNAEKASSRSRDTSCALFHSATCCSPSATVCSLQNTSQRRLHEVQLQDPQKHTLTAAALCCVLAHILGLKSRRMYFCKAKEQSKVLHLLAGLKDHTFDRLYFTPGHT